MIIATASISGSAITRISIRVAINHAQPKGRNPVNQLVIQPHPSAICVPRRKPGSSSARGPGPRLSPGNGWILLRSFRRLREGLAVDDFGRAALHRVARAGDGVGQIEVLD